MGSETDKKGCPLCDVMAFGGFRRRSVGVWDK